MEKEEDADYAMEPLRSIDGVCWEWGQPNGTGGGIAAFLGAGGVECAFIYKLGQVGQNLRGKPVGENLRWSPNYITTPRMQQPEWRVWVKALLGTPPPFSHLCI